MKTPLLHWLIFLISLLQIISVVAAQCTSDQKRLLLQLKRSLEFDSTASTKLARWSQSRDCCVWPGVECDTSGHVIGLFLDDEMITGGIQNSSSPLFSLQYLERLNLAFNRFISSSIPVEMYNLTNLTYLNLSNAGFGGQIPSGISRLTRLVTLDLSSNSLLKLENPNLNQFFENSIQVRQLYLDGVDISSQRSEWCQILSSSLPNLRVLSLQNYGVSGPIHPSLSKLGFLSEIYLDNNDLSSTVPKFLANFTNLKTLSLRNCNLQGEFPREIFQIQGLQELILEINANLSGGFPSFPENGSLKTIIVAHTQFSGSLPASIGNLGNLSRIEFNDCKFNGSIPSTMAQLSSLSYVDFSFNNFTGSIPHFQCSKNLTFIDVYTNSLTMAQLSSLSYVDFSFNNFTGSIPHFQCSKNLTFIDVSSNSLTGPLSSKHFQGLSKIVEINLGSNFLSGRIPPSLFSLPSLQRLHLSINSFDGQFDDEYLNVSASQLEILDLSSNRLNGSIPEYMFEFPNLKVLSLSSNSFSGRIQFESLQKLINLKTFEISHNNLSVDINSSISASSFFPQITTLKMASCRLQKFPDLRNQSILFDLDLSNNEIRGEIPSWIWELGSLCYLNLSHNFLDGLEKPYTIPNVIYILDLHSNQFQGQIPVAVAYYLDYSHNFFNGSIPFDLGSSAPVATFLSLSNNSFTGTIPESICNVLNMQVLDLSNNKLSGKLPSCLFNMFGSLSVLNLGQNQIRGNIPDSFPNNCTLKTLDLSRNSFQGKIPKSLMNCSSLEVLNVGSNKIVDTFPCPLKDLSSLRVLVLRSNGFHGGIHCANADHSWPLLQIVDIASNNFSGKLSQNSFLNWKGMLGDENIAQPVHHIKFDYSILNMNYYYMDTLMVTMKGREMEIVKILTVFKSLDFSSNNFEGIIPDTIGALTLLYVLNLSHNGFAGHIPQTIGNLNMVESLDLSSNQLDGQIPAQLAKLTFLSALNLSFNNFSGMIPTGNQLNTFEPDSYIGNQELCGFPLLQSCKSPPSSNGGESNTELDNASEIKWEYVTSALGFVVGLSVYLWMLLHNKRCREAYQQLDEVFLRLFGPRKRGRKSPGRQGRRVRRN